MPPQFPFGDGPVEPPRKPRNRLVLGAVGTGVIVAAAAAAFAGINWMNANNEKNDIRSLVGDFAAAVDSGDAATVAQYLCAEEAAALTAAGGAEQAPTSAPAAGDAAAAPAASASEITVKGDVASAVVSATDAAQDSSAAKTMYFAKEDGAWKVCMAAESDFPTEQ
jgi:ketosteroid isomerase-like protein